MLSSLLQPRVSTEAEQRVSEHSPFSSVYAAGSSPAAALQARAPRYATADFTETELDEESEDSGTEQQGRVHRGHVREVGADPEDDGRGDSEEEGDGEENDGEDGEGAPLLPIFSAAHLDSLPVYNITHAIRLIILQRTDTTLTWDQLRSPQVSQFLVKPMQQQIRTAHFSRATLYALIANSLQFKKESQENPGNAGVSITRAMICELIAIKLLKEYNTRELIDALSYDFYPLQGLVVPNSSEYTLKNRPRPAARISTFEIAIRASAKKFIAHPVVVQQLEAIWAGTIVFHSAADNLHRSTALQKSSRYKSQTTLSPLNRTYGTQTPHHSPSKQSPATQAQAMTRRTVTLYDPRDASLFKLSRLRVPRYRQFFSTLSLAILLGLFLAVLSRRCSDITTLEIFFWFWSTGFMLDELVGFNEQGFSLYIMSFWNAFDLGILLFLTIYYCMRLYGILLMDYGRTEWNSMAYDVLATTAILLFPRLFSVLDHYRYFSQLLIAFRLMAVDLAAVFVLILIACSGFFVAFTMSFSKDAYDAGNVAYKIFQMIMGFTPAAWEVWESYNFLGRAILVLFLFICHFLVVTILITVLTNSFMAIVHNANDEHQFVFAVNTISMVKNDALFSYVAPTNIVAWILTPLRFFLPFRTFIKMNRNVIKITHFPLLFAIYAYEILFLASSVFEPTDLVENGGRRRMISFQENGNGLFSPNLRRHESSVNGFQKDKALEEVFRLTPGPETIRINRKNLESRKTQDVNNWMDHQGGSASPPQEQDPAIVDRLENKRLAKHANFRKRGISRGISGTRSVASDPAEFLSSGFYDINHYSDARNEEGDGDDELVTNDDDEGATLDKEQSDDGNNIEEDYFQTPNASRFLSPNLPSSVTRSITGPAGMVTGSLRRSPPRKKLHDRNLSSTTILFNPIQNVASSSEGPSLLKPRPLTAKRSNNTGGTSTPAQSGQKTPKLSVYNAVSNARPILPDRAKFQSIPNFDQMGTRPRQLRDRRSSLDISMSEMAFDRDAVGAVPASFATQMAMATMMEKRRKVEGDDNGMMGRLMLARMKTLEEGFAEVVKEFRGIRTATATTAGNSSVEGVEDRRQKMKSQSGKRRGLGVRTKSELNAQGRTEKTEELAEEEGNARVVTPEDNDGEEEVEPKTPGTMIWDRDMDMQRSSL